MLTDRLGYHLKRLQQALRLAMDNALKDVGLTSSQYAALAALEAQAGASSAALARLCFVTPQTMNELVQSLVANGLVERQPHPEHGRIVQLFLSPKGKVCLSQAQQIIETVENMMLADLSPDERNQFVKWLQQCSQVLENYSATASQEF
jgi:DNA-binding MarR family transcriptional regulator